jgi:hypothetical protein
MRATGSLGSRLASLLATGVIQVIGCARLKRHASWRPAGPAPRR